MNKRKTLEVGELRLTSYDFRFEKFGEHSSRSCDASAASVGEIVGGQWFESDEGVELKHRWIFDFRVTIDD